MGFFDFFGQMQDYAAKPQATGRMDLRHQFLIAPHVADIAGARVLDLGVHDGRWAYAFAAAGADTVVAVEARAALVARFRHFPDPALRDRVKMRCADVFAFLEKAVAARDTYDVIAVFGLLYHVMDHFRLLSLCQRLNPRLIIVDSEFVLQPGPVVHLIRERTDKVLNATAQVPGQRLAIKGVPSRTALIGMADALGYDADFADWSVVPQAARTPVREYYRVAGMRRGTCVLRPRS